MSKKNAVLTYLNEVLGLRNVLMDKEDLNPFKESEEKILLIVKDDIKGKEQVLLDKIALASPVQPVEIVKVNPNWDQNLIEEQLNLKKAKRGLVFGEDLFQAMHKTEKPYFDFIQNYFSFNNINFFASHELTDMTKTGGSTSALKKQVWMQFKQLKEDFHELG